jgi:hypothetical protein
MPYKRRIYYHIKLLCKQEVQKAQLSRVKSIKNLYIRNPGVKSY